MTWHFGNILWKYYSVTAFIKFSAAYNKCIKKLFGYARRDSMSGIFLQLSLPTADTIVYNSHVLFASHCSLSCSQIVQWFTDIAVWSFYIFFSFMVLLCILACFSSYFSMDYGLKSMRMMTMMMMTGQIF